MRTWTLLSSLPYHMVRHITTMTDNEITLFKLDFSNIVCLEKEHHVQGDYEYFQRTLDQVPFWLKDIQARAHKETTCVCLIMMREQQSSSCDLKSRTF